METNKKKTGKRIMFALIVLLLAGSLVALPFIMEAKQGNGSSASTLSSKAELGTIRKSLSGTGTLTEQDAETIRKKQWPDLSIEEIEAIINNYGGYAHFNRCIN